MLRKPLVFISTHLGIIPKVSDFSLEVYFYSYKTDYLQGTVRVFLT